MHTVKFLTKNVVAGDPEYRLVTDREAHFTTFQAAMEFLRSIRQRLSSQEILIGTPELEVA